LRTTDEETALRHRVRFLLFYACTVKKQ